MNENIRVARCKVCYEKNVDDGIQCVSNDPPECAVCQNTGMVIVPPNGFLCVKCRGTGKIKYSRCEFCGGLGVLLL